jgi:RNA polymerase sigma-70 factor (ECF subfamily)
MVAVLTSRKAPTQAEFHAAISSRSDRWYSACLKITRNPDLAQDAVQDALLSAWNKRHQFDQSARLDTWIHRIAINAALQLLRKNRRGDFVPLADEVEGPAPTPESAHADEQLGQSLAAALTHLSEIERICFVLKHLEQWRLAEIAEQIDSNVGTVKQAIFRAVKKLRTHLACLQREAL